MKEWSGARRWLPRQEIGGSSQTRVLAEKRKNAWHFVIAGGVEAMKERNGVRWWRPRQEIGGSSQTRVLAEKRKNAWHFVIAGGVEAMKERNGVRWWRPRQENWRILSDPRFGKRAYRLSAPAKCLAG